MSEEDVSEATPDFIIPFKTVGGESMNETNPTHSSYLSETVNLKSAPLNPSLLARLKRQKHKYWHFTFVNPSDLNEFKKRIIGSDPTLTVHENEGGQQHADITIRKNQDIIGKLHFLHVNRPDICEPEKFYVKVHYYHFTDKVLMDNVKAAVQLFFDNMEEESISQPTSIGGKRHRTLRNKRVTRRKRSTKRSKKRSKKRQTKRNARRNTRRHTLRHKN